MQMKKTCIIRNIALDDVDEKNMYYKNIAHLMMQMKKTCIIKNTFDDVDEKNMYYKNCTCIIKIAHL